jgi:hypothetical protein
MKQIKHLLSTKVSCEEGYSYHKHKSNNFSSEQERKVNTENWQKKPYFRSTKIENAFINVRKK